MIEESSNKDFLLRTNQEEHYKDYSSIIYKGEIIGKIRYSIWKRNVVKIENLILLSEYRRRGLGTQFILFFKEKYKGCIFWGDILYPLAFEFWKSLEDKVEFIEPLDFYNEYECYFSFK